MITEFHAKDYGPLKDASCKLTPLHAFIGPNDSGKSTLLRGLVSVVNYAANKQPQFFFPKPGSSLKVVFGEGNSGAIVDGDWNWGGEKPTKVLSSWVSQGSKLCRFDADALRQPSSLTTAAERLNWIDRRGLGLPGALDILLRRNDGSFQEISREFAAFFPTVARLELPIVSNTETHVAAVLTDGTEVGAAFMSEGMLYYLAFATLRRLTGAALIAIEEPETGLHPARIAEVMRILREISGSGTQVIIATHSPLVVNELEPGEVSVVTRTADVGTKVRLISETPHFGDRSKVYALGELWLSYANGVDESPLLNGTTREIPDR